jgi:hypothetical protein
MKKVLTYLAAIALLTAGSTFVQAQSGAAGVNGSTVNNSTPTPAAKGTAEGVPPGAGEPGRVMNRSGSRMNQPGVGSSGAHRSRHMNTATKARSNHGRSERGSTSVEDEETMRLNRQQLSGSGT